MDKVQRIDRSKGYISLLNDSKYIGYVKVYLGSEVSVPGIYPN
jgi:hypothetical protein